MLLAKLDIMFVCWLVGWSVGRVFVCLFDLLVG